MESNHPVFATVRKQSPLLFTTGMLMFLGAIGASVGLFVDDRTLMGINVWVKPLKFLISVGIYMLTVGYLLHFYPYSRLKKNVLLNTVTLTMVFEILIIVYQAYRGVQSHYNFSTPLDGMLFGLMGVMIAINVFLMALFAFDALRLKLQVARPIQWGIFLGWVIMIGGSWVGGRMISQMAHTVGVEDGGVGLPLLNWSTVAGDLRVAHFLGLHAIQAIPLFALLLTRTRLPQSVQRTGVVVFSLVYATAVGYTFYQASQGLPFLGQGF